jgi:hypothetical protein
MEQQIQSDGPSEFTPRPKLSREQIEMFKTIARERAIAESLGEQNTDLAQSQRLAAPPPSIIPQQPQQPQIIYLRRNFTVAELGLVLLLSCGIVLGAQGLWGLGSRMLPQIEIKVK